MVNSEKLTKLYYSIGEVADLFQVNASLIRFWEKEFKLIQPKKNKKGNRLFTKKDIENINKIYHLVKEEGYTLEGAKKVLDNKQTNEPTKVQPDEVNHQLVHKLEKIKNRLTKLKS